MTTIALALALATAAVAQDAPAPEAPAGPVSYTLQSSKSDLYVVIRNDTSASLARLGHDHVIYASSFSGKVTWSASDPGACAVDISVPVTKLIVDPPGLRDRAGLDDNTIDDDDKASLKKNMWGKSQLDAGTFSQVSFKAVSCSGTSGAVAVTGDLTIRGVTQRVEVPMKVTLGDGTFSAKGSLETSHSAFEFKPFRASPFGPRNQDRLTLVVQVKGTAG